MDKEFAWFLGCLLSDGSITRPTYRNKGDETHLQWQIKATDDNLLYKIKSILGTRAEVRYYDPYPGMLSKPFCKLRIYDRKDVIKDYDDIKTNIPEIPLQLTRHFIRGIIDGDGTIYVRPNRSSSASTLYLVNAEYDIMKWYSEFMSELFLVPFKEPRRIEKDHIWSVSWEGRIARLMTWYLYHGEIQSCVLDRKKQYYKDKILYGVECKNSFEELLVATNLSIEDNLIDMNIQASKSLDWCKRIQKVLGAENSTPIPVNKGVNKYYKLHIPSNLIINTQDNPFWD